jgi:hypothetical protein
MEAVDLTGQPGQDNGVMIAGHCRNSDSLVHQFPYSRRQGTVGLEQGVVAFDKITGQGDSVYLVIKGGLDNPGPGSSRTEVAELHPALIQDGTWHTGRQAAQVHVADEQNPDG